MSLATISVANVNGLLRDLSGEKHSNIAHIDPNKTYTWYSGIWHGMFFIPNFIRSCIGDALYKANEYTTAYNVWWWITTVGAVGSTVFGYWGNRRSGY